MGMERTFFGERRESLCADYAMRAQGLVDEWEAASEAVRALGRKRLLDVRIITFFGSITVWVRQGIDDKGRWVSPALAFLGIRPHQRYSPDMEKRMAVLAAETGSYEKAATVAEATWFAVSDDTVRAVALRLAKVAQNNPPVEMRSGAATPEDTLIVMADGWNARHRGENWGRDKKDRTLPEHTLGAALHGAGTSKAAAWCGRILHDLKHKSPKRLFKTLDQLLKDPPSDDPAVREAIREQNAYFRNHANHMDYAANAALGVPIGSGPVESLCSQFQNRLKRTGPFWTKTGFAALLQVTVRHWNRELDSLWRVAA
jgi:hypothetical protein